jgi:GNAT superfamily N-acetyltransferase
MIDTPISIRKGQKADLPQVLDLIVELAIYEKAPQEVTITLEALENDGFGPQPVYGLFVAESAGRIIGIALYYLRYSTWKGRCLYLEDIVVREEWRGKGIGTLLFDEVALVAKNDGYKALVWQVLDWNEPALHFYRKYEAQLDPEWINGKLTADQLAQFVPRSRRG